MAFRATNSVQTFLVQRWKRRQPLDPHPDLPDSFNPLSIAFGYNSGQSAGGDMSGVGDTTIRHWVSELDETEAQIKALQDAKRDLYSAIRDEHGKTTADGLKAAMKIHRMDGEKREAAEAIDAEAFRILSVIEKTPAHAPRATRIETVEQFDAETGEITDEPEAAADATGNFLREPVAAEQGQIVRGGDAPHEASAHVTGEGLTSEASYPDNEFPAEPTNVFSMRPAKKLRPNCLNPDKCGGMGPKHCHSCTKAMNDRSAGGAA